MDSAATGYTNLFQYAESGVTRFHYFKGVTNGVGSGTVEPTTPTTYDTAVDPVGVGSYTITSSDGVNLRSGAGTTYDKLTAIPYNTVVKVTKVSGDWGYTTYNGKSGWFSTKYAKMTVTVRGVQVTAPTKTAYKIGESFSSTGMKVTVLYSDGTSKAITSGYTVNGFSSKAAGSYKVYVTYQKKSAVFTVTVSGKTYEAGTYRITSDNGVNLRSTASADGTVITAIPHDAVLDVTEVKNNWGKTSYKGAAGWICLDYAEYQGVTPPKQTGITVTTNKARYLASDVTDETCLTVKRVFADGTKTALKEFECSVVRKDGTVIFTVTDGDFSQSVTCLLYDGVPPGDVNFDGKVDAADALQVLRYAIGKSGKTEFYAEAADVNGDGKSNAADALLILKFAVGKIKEF